ncbi:MAG: hypothetical protein Q8Q28_01555 [Pseudomonadota bacterium]|nr:hypothetical protein [Pseudomonadota bacterium]
MTDILNKHHPLSPNGVDEEVRNASGNLPLEEVMQARLSRRNVLKGGFGLAASSFMGLSLAAA